MLGWLFLLTRVYRPFPSCLALVVKGALPDLISRDAFKNNVLYRTITSRKPCLWWCRSSLWALVIQDLACSCGRRKDTVASSSAVVVTVTFSHLTSSIKSQALYSRHFFP